MALPTIKGYFRQVQAAKSMGANLFWRRIYPGRQALQQSIKNLTRRLNMSTAIAAERDRVNFLPCIKLMVLGIRKALNRQKQQLPMRKN
jgi:hypothetical protein